MTDRDVSDRTLLELAAKAAGKVCGYEPGEWFWCKHGPRGPGMYMSSRSHVLWNPITDDGDALRLAVRLRMCVASFPDETMVGYTANGEGYNVHESHGSDPYADTRRAIVRAAAEIGRSMTDFGK